MIHPALQNLINTHLGSVSTSGKPAVVQPSVAPQPAPQAPLFTQPNSGSTQSYVPGGGPSTFAGSGLAATFDSVATGSMTPLKNFARKFWEEQNAKGQRAMTDPKYRGELAMQMSRSVGMVNPVSVAPAGFYHVTSQANADAIAKDGFDVAHRSVQGFEGGPQIPSPKVMGNSLNASNDPRIIQTFKDLNRNSVALPVTLAKDAKVMTASSEALLTGASHAYPDLFLKNPEAAISKYVTQKLGADAIMSADPMEGLAVYNLKKALINGKQAGQMGIGPIVKAAGATVGTGLLGIPAGQFMNTKNEIFVDNYKLPKKGPAEFTAYDPHDRRQTDDSPGIMASGKKYYDGAIATSDYSIPFGTKVYVPELKKTFIVEDRMNRRYSPDKYGKTVFDIPMTDGKAKNFGRQQLSFHVLQ